MNNPGKCTSRINRPVMAILLMTVLILAILLPALPAHADSGLGLYPKMTFTFEHQGEPVRIMYGKMLECNDSICSAPETRICDGYGGFSCSGYSCSAELKGPNCSSYHKLVITFTDKTRESNVFSVHGLDIRLKVTVNEDSLYVKQDLFNLTGRWGFLIALLVTLFTECIVA
jgi:hypothetical protein